MSRRARTYEIARELKRAEAYTGPDDDEPLDDDWQDTGICPACGQPSPDDALCAACKGGSGQH